MKIRHVVALALLPLVTVAGCGDGSSDSQGVESKPAAQILDEAAAALRRVKSFHVEGTQGTANRRTKVAADVGLPTKLRLAIREGPSSASIVVVDGSLYIKANAAYWKKQAGRAAQQLAGKWLKSPTSTAVLRDVTKGLDAETLSHCLAQGHGTIQKGGAATVDGKRAVVLIDKGDRPGSAPSKLFVAAEGEPLPLRTIATGNQRRGGTKDPRCSSGGYRTHAGDESTFSRYDESLDITAPPGAVDLGGGTSS